MVCVAAILGLAYWVTQKRAGIMGGSFSAGGRKIRMELLSQMVLGKSERLLIVQAVGRYFLLGVTGGAITVLAELSPEEIEAYRTNESANPQEKQSFFLGLLENERKKRQG